MPVSTVSVTEDGTAAVAEGAKLEESYMRNSLMHSLLADSTPSQPTHTQRTELARRELEVDKVLLQLINVECREGEERGMKALELVNLLSDANGRMVEAAGKVAARYGHTVLGEKIAELAERRLLGEGEEVE
ncbi:MAG: DNA polymerase alpha accessory factor Mcl1 [Ramalina farinacea]|uniref:DNA polymerase alpha accessory factor Mcl1 n=1 Tax=Ramalina farinacea TaxID=258253 RepID=A0AA43QPK3_9LECA|nr:DNA polymerase alpha accessory factor Mcl1 [Ramalina farinacea]